MLFPKYQEYFILFFLQHNVLYVASIFERTMHGYDYNLPIYKNFIQTDRQTDMQSVESGNLPNKFTHL